MKIEYQRNAESGLAYQGRNQADLLAEKAKHGYTSNEWVTFLQAQKLGLKIKKSSKATAVFKGFGTDTVEREDKDGNKKLRTVSVPLGFARVFNLDQTEPYKRD